MAALIDELRAEWTPRESVQTEPLLASLRLDDVLRVAAARAEVEAEECPMTIAESTRPTVALFQGEPWV